MADFCLRWRGLSSNQGYPYVFKRVDLETALEIVTINGAHAMKLEKVTGSIEVGKDADMIVLKKNLFKIPVEKIIDTKVERTVLKGKTVYPQK